MAVGDRTDQLIAQVRSRIAEPSEQGTLDTDIVAFLNEGQLDLCLQVDDAALGCLGEQVTAALTLDEAPYTLPTDFMRERIVTYKTKVARRLRVVDLGALIWNVYMTPKETRPFYYLWDGPSLWLRAGTKTAGNYILNYLKIPTDMSTSVDPTLTSEFDQLLVTFAVMRCREATGDSVESERLWVEYLDRCTVLNSRYSGGLPYDGVAGDRR